ncbi:hypothetical protein B7486_14000 [cyanobacterium TDX16]|nr:hypothetical protein B7486_14000 [cyanobacterium TDX16]
MVRFAAGIALTGCAIILLNVIDEIRHGIDVSEIFEQAMVLVIFPTCCAAVVISVWHERSPRKVFLQVSSSTPQLVLSGLLVGILGWGMTLGGILALDSFVPDGLTIGCSFVLATALALWRMRPPAPGHCMKCDYDLRTSLEFGRCPECGLAF